VDFSGYVRESLSAISAGRSKFITRDAGGDDSIPIAVGLILMMYPPLGQGSNTKRWEGLQEQEAPLYLPSPELGDRPIVMFVLAIIFLHNYPEYMIGVFLLGLAGVLPCDRVERTGSGDREVAVGLVAFNAVAQVLFYASLYLRSSSRSL